MSHLREIEEANSLLSRVIHKARWIKPTERRRNGQTQAHAILTIASVDIANKLIKDGLGICGRLIRPTKQKQEPIQCMKCRRWGHFADKCPETEDTCGTCGGKHRTSACTINGRFHCVSCDVSSHASWDRACPEFIRRCAAIDEKNLVNNMPFFPAEQDWTHALAARPSRIPFEDRFPTSYAVNSLPALGTRKAQRRKGTNPAGNPTPANPNKILLPEKNRYSTREPGELVDNGEGISDWMREPIESGTDFGNTDSDVTLQSKIWI